MSRYKVLLQNDPDASPVIGQSVQIRRVQDQAVLATPVSGVDGIVDWYRDAHPGPVYLAAEGVPGGGRYWDSRDAFNAGAVALSDVPAALFDLEGVVRVGESDFGFVAPGDTWVVLEPGAAVVAGFPVVCFNQQVVTFDRPATSFRMDRIVIRILPEGVGSLGAGLCGVVRLAGPLGGPPVVPHQGDDYWEQSLYLVAIPASGPLQWQDERTFAGEHPDIVAQSVTLTPSTSSLEGEPLPGGITMFLPRRCYYDVFLDATAIQASVATGYGGIAIAVDPGGGMSPYIMTGPAPVEIANAHQTVVLGPNMITATVWGKAGSGTMQLAHTQLNVRAIPRRD